MHALASCSPRAPGSAVLQVAVAYAARKLERLCAPDAPLEETDAPPPPPPQQQQQQQQQQPRGAAGAVAVGVTTPDPALCALSPSGVYASVRA